jgi:hypothetical protein
MVLIRNSSSFIANQRNSPLLRLPAELRNRIYELVFDGTAIRVIKPTMRVRVSGFCALSSVPPTKSFSLQHSCRQIALEAFGLFVPYATFELDFKWNIDTLLEKLGPQKCHIITSIRLSQDLAIYLPDMPWAWSWMAPRTRVGEFPGLKRVYVSGVDAYLSEFMRGKMAAAVRNCFGIAHLNVIME